MAKAAQSLLLVIAQSLVATAPAASCIGPPAADLWQLVEEADQIVIADVRSVRPTALNRFLRTLLAAGRTADAALEHISRDGAMMFETVLYRLPELDKRSWIARLEVHETLHGSAPGTFDLRFDTWGAVFVPDETVVVFLRRGRWAPTLLDYSNSVLFTGDSAELHDLRTAVLAAAELQRRSGEASRLAWSLDAASRPGSRPYVLERLTRQKLSHEHQRALADGFVDSPTFNTLKPMLTVLAGYRDRAFDLQAAALISAALSEPQIPWWRSSGALEAMLTRLGVGDEIPWCEEASLRFAWQELVSKLGFPPPGSRELAAVRDSAAAHRRLLDKVQATYR